jgi:hypothetical protein
LHLRKSGMNERPRNWRYLNQEEVTRLKDMQRRTFDETSAKEDGLKLATDGSLQSLGRAVRIESGSIEDFARVLDEAFPP